ncbi:hypothetical protein VNI00_007765 [Paramarasmius palmivorus]|uniref:Uncharacterized protein n=1 Tax=Paramarasmius palmivorus TaxID=297713 RepID=A0AAW0CZA1_9AGAR
MSTPKEFSKDYVATLSYIPPKTQLHTTRDTPPTGSSSESALQLLYTHTLLNEFSLYHSFKPAKPGQIRKGDIVEVQFTVSLIETTTGKGRHAKPTYITKLILRAITQLDSSFTEASRYSHTYTIQPGTLKRKVGHEEEETRETQDRIKRMAVDSTDPA